MTLRILHCVEFYAPSRGGSQALVRHISEDLVRRGHTVTVATTQDPRRSNQTLEGVSIREFAIAGNAVNGMRGEVDHYQRFVLEGEFDILMTYSAQQWTTDALLPVIDQIPYRTLLGPCGFSQLGNPRFRSYYQSLPGLLAKFDQLIFHSDTYQDIEFARERGLANLTLIPNGASRKEFGELGTSFRQRHAIDPDEPLLLTVGPHNWIKGHALAIEAFRRSGLERGTLVVVGNRPLRLGCQWDCRRRALTLRLRTRGRKRVILLDPPREEVLEAYKAADLFVFGSQVECSPLVLFEAAASATPFVSSAAGNAAEIANWTGGGVVVPSTRRDGRVFASPDALASELTNICADPVRRRQLARTGRERWLHDFTWERIAGLYEDVYEREAARAR